MRRVIHAAMALGATLVLAIGAGGAAQAQPESGLSGASAAATGNSCVLHAAANVESPTTTTRCFATFEEAVSAATSDKVKLRPGQRVLTQAELAQASDTVVGIEYKDANFGGQNLILTTGAGFTCSGGLYVNFGSMPSGWDNTIGSARSYANCKSGHFEYTNNGGSVKICGCATMGALNDKTSSIRFSVSGL